MQILLMLLLVSTVNLCSGFHLENLFLDLIQHSLTQADRVVFTVTIICSEDELDQSIDFAFNKINSTITYLCLPTICFLIFELYLPLIR